MAMKPPSEPSKASHALAGHERDSVKARLAQIEAELRFPELTDGQAASLEQERMVLLSKLALDGAPRGIAI
jgi:hypothetical protein